MLISLCPEREVSFRSNHSVTEAVKKLSARLQAETLHTKLKGGIFGIVRPEKVLLKYYRPWLGYYIVFTGTFSMQKDSVLLSGRFESSKPIQVANLCWLLCIIFFFCFPFMFISNSAIVYDFLAIPIVILLIWVCNFAFYCRLWRGGVHCVIKTINDALL
jgi:hypothetical protein